MARETAAHNSDGGGNAIMGKGVCIICGREAFGIPAKQDSVILVARKLRSLLHRKPLHTIVEKAHLKEARQKRARFEKKLWEHRIAAVIVFVLLALGSLAVEGFSFWLFIPAALGALFVWLLAFAYYFPEF